MTYRVHELQLAQADIRSIFDWIRKRSPQGANAWLDAYDAMIDGLRDFIGHGVTRRQLQISKSNRSFLKPHTETSTGHCTLLKAKMSMFFASAVLARRKSDQGNLASLDIPFCRSSAVSCHRFRIGTRCPAEGGSVVATGSERTTSLEVEGKQSGDKAHALQSTKCPTESGSF